MDLRTISFSHDIYSSSITATTIIIRSHTNIIHSVIIQSSSRIVSQGGIIKNDQ